MNKRLHFTNILITGKPGVGKSTCVRYILQEIPHVPVVGFVTDEIRERGYRAGFALQVLEGPTFVLAHKTLPSLKRVGAYGVNLKNLEAALQIIHKREQQLGNQFRLYCIDEIGKMEAISADFRQWVETVMDSPWPVVATIALKGTPWIESLKQKARALIFHLTLENRKTMCQEILQYIEQRFLPEH